MKSLFRRSKRIVATLLSLVLVLGTVANCGLTVSAAETPQILDNLSEAEKSVTLQIAKWAGSVKDKTATEIYADLDHEGDELDSSSKITLSTGKSPCAPDTTILGGQGLTAGEYFQIDTSSKKYQDITLSFYLRGSGTAAKSYTIQYSINGVDYTTITTISLDKSGVLEPFQVKLPQGANNVETLSIRAVAGNISIGGKEPAAGSVIRLNNVALSGVPVEDDSICSIVSVTPDAGSVALNEEITMNTKTEGATMKYSFDGVEYFTYDASNKPVLATLPATVTVYAEKEGIEDSLKVTYGYTQSQVETVKATPNGGAILKNTKVELSTKTEGAAIYYSFDNGTTWSEYNETDKLTISSLPATITVKAIKDGYLDSEKLELNYTERENENYNIYFGQLHSHTGYSDGAGSIFEAFEYATKQAEQIDFLAITDHSNSFDGIDSATILGAEDSKEWKEGHEVADQYTTDNFVGLFGYEMTWSNGLGHMNTFNTEGFQSRTQKDYSSYATSLQNYYAALKKDTGSISQFNHPGTSFGDFNDFGHYDETIDSLINLVEVGNGEGAIGSSGYFPSYEYYTRALDKGWHVAPTNNQDNHKGKWGDANTGRTVVLADSLTRENIYDALRNKRVYASEDNDLKIMYQLDGNVMGTSLEKDAVGNKATITVDLEDPTDASIGTVQVIVNGGLVVESKEVKSNKEVVTFEVDTNYSYYYIKVIQKDGNIAVTAPVWVGEVEAVGISSVETTTALPIVGEELDVNVSLFNNETSDLLIDSMVFSIGDNIIHEAKKGDAGLSDIKSMQTGMYSFKYTHNTPGDTNIDVTVNATLNGVSKLYKGVLKVSYVISNMVTKIVIDGTHYNDYVSGYYGKNMGNFTKIASDEFAKVEIVTDQITEETLEDAAVLIISAPAKKTGTGNAGAYTPAHFEDEFLETVKNYTNRGGTVIVCGIADYQDTTSAQSSTELNKLLAAIGATITINSDQAVDDENNGGQAYRLYLTELNKESEFMKNTVEGQEYSAYSGCTVNITNATEDTETAKAAEWLVKGYETTYSLNTKDEDGNKLNLADQNVVVEKGDVVALARQELAGGGNVFVAGTVFMSDFEVKAELDNIWDVPYANRTIMENLLKQVKAELPISTIKEARQGNLKDVFRVQGTVTAGTSVEGNTFFDTIYIQDATGGMTIFPYATAGLQVGATVEIIGYLDAYQGDIELQIMESTILDNENLNPLEATKLSAKDAMDYEAHGGELIQVEGTVIEIDANGDSISQLRVKDQNGDVATVFIDGYILSATTGKNELAKSIKVGDQVSATGLLYKHPEGDSEESVSCLRVRNVDEVKKVEKQTESTEDTKPEDTTTGDTTTDSTEQEQPEKLPQTGSMATKVFPTVLACMMLASLVLVTRRKKAQ